MKKLFEEFKTFAFKGNVIDMAVGVMIATAFGAIVTSVVSDLLTPLIAAIFGSPDFSGIVLTIGETPIMIGNFLNAVINFLIIAVCIFAFVKGINKLKKPAPAPVTVKNLCPYCRSEVDEKATRCPHCTAEMKPIKE